MAGGNVANIVNNSIVASSINNFNRPWAGNYGWYNGSWGGWPCYPAFWSGLGYGDWLSPWAGDYFDFDNPYYDPSLYTSLFASGVVPDWMNYSQPIPIPTEDQIDNIGEDVVADAANHSALARADFRQGLYDDATREAELALQDLPSDRTMHEFLALCLFARQKYDAAAGVIYAVLAAGPGWNWDTMASFYPDIDVYTQQLRDLEAYVNDNPTDGAAHFLLAYHYLVLDERDAAIAELRTAARLMQDRLADQLADALSAQPRE